jgi:hypothetical protein
LKMRWKAELPKMPRLPSVPLAAVPVDAARNLGPPPSPSAYREKNPSETPPTDYKAPSMLAEHRGLALLFLAAMIAFALYCWRAPRRAVALDAPAQSAGAARSATAPAPAPAPSPEASQSPVYVETLPDRK